MKVLEKSVLGLAACVLLVAGTACGDDDEGDETPTGASPTSAAATPSDGGETVEVLLNEFSVLPDPDSVAEGEVTFRVTNEGPDDVHEFVIIATALEADALPTVEDGSVDETGVEVIDEIEDIAVGDTQEVTVDSLEAGPYVLICNIVEEEDGVTESHYQLGMRRAFTVE
jgi:uncharacterized cupredoxin-like copper-binding protein